MEKIELRKLSREHLLQMLIEQSEEVEALKEKNKELEEKLQNREILIQEAGSIAEAALKINGIFEAAQAAADQYLENIKRVQKESEQ